MVTHAFFDRQTIKFGLATYHIQKRIHVAASAREKHVDAFQRQQNRSPQLQPITQRQQFGFAVGKAVEIDEFIGGNVNEFGH